MPPIPEPRVPAEFDSDDEESLLILSSMGKKCYSDLFSENDQTETTSTASLDSEDANAKSIDSELAAAEGGGGSCVMRVWGAYYGALGRWPLLIKSITALILMALADFFAQMVEHLHRISYDSWVDILRMLRFGVFGLVGAPWTHYYYAWLDRTLPPTPQPWTMTTAVKVVIDQFAQAPALLALIISGLAFMEGRGLDGIKEDMQKQYMYSLIQNWKLWIPATVINIAFVKPDLRVLYDNLIFLVWTVYLSMILNDRDRMS